MRKSTLLITTAVGLTLICSPAPARPALSANLAKAPPGLKKATAAQRPSPGDRLKEKAVFVDWSVATVYLSQYGFSPEDMPFQFDCKKACTVVTDGTAQFFSVFAYEVALCPVVDGYFTNGACYFSGTLPPRGPVNRTNQTNISAGSGVHTFQTYLYHVAPTYLGHYQNDYHIYE